MKTLQAIRTWLLGCPVCFMPSVLRARGRYRRHLVFCRYGRMC